ncbi:MAG: acetamidase/formamidase family protein [Candidatus Thermoplasmatota archaeon]|nr:acetamidase/formamidase family protein [Candidatus Thermoplasmatota archaeon]
MRRLNSRKSVAFFSSKNKAAYKVAQNERVIVETRDCFSGLVKSSTKKFEDIPMSKVNPATGPIEVDGLVAGDVLCVSIEKIKLGNMGVTVCSPELGNLARDVRRSVTKIIPIKGERARFSDDLWVDLRPHVGVIGVSPANGELPTYYPGDHGGNLDTVEIGDGSKVYLPTFVDGAMVALGDVHASMGDGEVCGTGIETAADVTVRLMKAEGLDIARPMIETSKEWMSYAAAKTLDEAARLATSDMVRFISNSRGVGFEESYMLASVAADLRISQVVDPLVAVRMAIQKKYL